MSAQKPVMPLHVVEGANYDAVMIWDGNVRKLATIHHSREVAEFIVRACNAHEALVKALKATYCPGDDGHCAGDEDARNCRHCAETRAVLALCDAPIADATKGEVK